MKRCVRDVLSKKRMVAFILLDSPQESIVDLMVILPNIFYSFGKLDKINSTSRISFCLIRLFGLQEASFQGGNIKFSKYLDSFPFPYYIVLKNIEALPRTLADLLRQVGLLFSFFFYLLFVYCMRESCFLKSELSSFAGCSGLRLCSTRESNFIFLVSLHFSLPLQKSVREVNFAHTWLWFGYTFNDENN